MSEIPTTYQINSIQDIRGAITISGYTKTEAIETLLDCIHKGLFIDANYWAAELLASNLYSQLWVVILTVYFRWINYLNPLLIDYLYQKYLLFGQIRKTYTKRLPEICNHQVIRNHLAEMITILCLVPKTVIVIPSTLDNNQKTDYRTNQVIQLIAPNVPQNSPIRQLLVQLVNNYYLDDIDNCIYLLNIFVQETENTIEPIKEITVPPILSHRSIWLVWRFILLQFKLLTSAQQTMIVELLDNVLTFYLYMYQKKSFESCVDIMALLLFMARHTDCVCWHEIIPTKNSIVIQQCATINLIYQKINQTKDKMQNEGRKKDKSKDKSKNKSKVTKQMQIKKTQFFSNVKNQEYIRVINDWDSLRMGRSSLPISLSSPIR